MSIFNILASVALIGILIFVHELGHFIFAKMFGVGVREFSLGFGRRLFGVKYGETDYRVCLLPVGGYVLMEGADPFLDEFEQAEEADSEKSLLNKPVWQRLIIVAAGPVFNLLLPVVLLTGLYMAGQPQEISEVNTVYPGSVAEQVGIEPGDVIAAVNGVEIEFLSDLYREMETVAPSDTLVLDYTRGGARHQVEIAPGTLTQSGEPVSWAYGGAGLGMVSGHPDAQVGVDDPASPAARAGVESFDLVLKVDGADVGSYRELLTLLDGKQSAALEWVNRAGEVEQGEILLDDGWGGHEGDKLGNPWGLFPATLFVDSVQEESAAADAGLTQGDRLYAIDGVALQHWSEVTSRIGAKQVGEGEEATAVPVELTIARAGELITQELTPRVVQDTDMLGRYYYRPVIGVGRGGDFASGTLGRKYYGPVESFGMAVEETTALVGLTLSQIGKLITREAAPSKTLGGPVQIFRDAGAAAKAGAFQWFRLMALLSISLAIINFLPVPVLDGGQFLFFLVEWIRGRPVSLRFRERAQQVGVLALVSLMLMVFVFDINRALGGG